MRHVKSYYCMYKHVAHACIHVLFTTYLHKHILIKRVCRAGRGYFIRKCQVKGTDIIYKRIDYEQNNYVYMCLLSFLGHVIALFVLKFFVGKTDRYYMPEQKFASNFIVIGSEY